MPKKLKAQNLLPEVTDDLTSAFEKPDVDALVEKGKEALSQTGERLERQAEKTKADFNHAMTVRKP